MLRVAHNGYLSEAERLFRLATKEYSRAKKTKSEDKARQSAEKAYLSLLKTTDALFIAKGIEEKKLPHADRGRYYFLSKYADREIRSKFYHLRDALHIKAWHEGIIIFKDLDEEFNDLEELISKVKVENYN